MQLEYEVKFSTRKTLNITVERDRRVVVRAPEHLSMDKIKALVQSKRQWIKEKLNHAQKYPLIPESKEFVSGETLMYLGRNYQLIVVDEEIEEVEFNQRFRISRKSQANANKLFKKWYLRQALQKIEPLAKEFARSLGVKYKECKTSEMRYRWGSCTPNNNIIFNWRIIKAPMYVVNYLVAHELVHLIEDNHTPRFWNILSIQVPNYQKAKDWLKNNGHLLEVDF
ncbi:M48 family metallopeptidase [Pontibacter qinzhouensis]|uniref:M48 family metallopeptidase n=1 Tax=Pontibacter qinzhouensis TaxID=2603253 RepID=A0A5C8IUH5_9BACT|nr:SprT family zinc-dependent metalloprotease [Pontibacter qinzhouensis]TXK24927.1 M48 family metallopeptidase [Pontibacter qinzhouensis]